jgi:hypothetical protein
VLLLLAPGLLLCRLLLLLLLALCQRFQGK